MVAALPPKSGPWGDAEIASAQVWLRDGVLMKDIAQRLGRSFDAVAYKLRKFAQSLAAERTAARQYGKLPDSFKGLLGLFHTYGHAAGWLGVSTRTAKSKAGRDWVPRKYWNDLLRGLEHDAPALAVTSSHLESLAVARGRWDRPTPVPCDWSDLPAMETAIARIVMRWARNEHLAADAAGYAVLEMMEFSKPYLGYGVRCAFNYLKGRHVELRRLQYLTDDELRVALDMRMFTPPAQLHALRLSEVMRAGESLPSPYRAVFHGLCSGESDAELATRMGIAESTAVGHRAHTRKLLAAYADLDDGALASAHSDRVHNVRPTEKAAA